MNDLLASLEASTLGDAMRGAGVWAYGLVNLAHIVGIASLFGSVLLLDLRLLGVWSSVPLRSISTPAVPVARAGFALAAMSGACLLATNATEYEGNPFLPIKFVAIALGVLNVGVLQSTTAWKAHRTRELSATERRSLVAAGGLSLICWTTALAAGRMIGYW